MWVIDSPLGLSEYFPSSWTMEQSGQYGGRRHSRPGAGWVGQHTVPLVTLSWLLLPVTLKSTLLGVLLLTSMVPAEAW